MTSMEATMIQSQSRLQGPRGSDNEASPLVRWLKRPTKLVRTFTNHPSMLDNTAILADPLLSSSNINNSMEGAVSPIPKLNITLL